MNSIFFLRNSSSRLITQFVCIFLPYKPKYHAFKFYRVFSTQDYPGILTHVKHWINSKVLNILVLKQY